MFWKCVLRSAVYKQLVNSFVDFKNNETYNPIIEALYSKGLFVVVGEPSHFYGRDPGFYVVTEDKLKQHQQY